MNVSTTVVINHRNCPYTIKGENIANMRRAQLQRIGAKLGITGDMSKNDLLTRLMATFEANQLEHEIGEIAGV